MTIDRVEELYDSGMTVGLMARHLGVTKDQLEDFMDDNAIFKMDRKQHVAVLKTKKRKYKTIFLRVGDFRNTVIEVRARMPKGRQKQILEMYRKKLIKKKK